MHGAGIHPGGLTERLPLVVSALSGSVTGVRAEEFSDIRTYGAPDVVRHWMMFGADPEQAAAGTVAAMLAGGYSQSVWMIADELGFDLDPDIRTTHDIAVATAPIDSPIGVIDRRHRAGTGCGTALSLGGHGRRRTGDHGGGQLVHG
ncbi:hypothetical protein [Nocardia nova]|uniref:hypothetical protein n=1 Tax=Nocardia nova TaxID=37330 RepID=UPI0015E2DC6B|nr:hypothetical protein [Nocardia nova]